VLPLCLCDIVEHVIVLAGLGQPRTRSDVPLP
jgi:hypothetical protein